MSVRRPTAGAAEKLAALTEERAQLAAELPEVERSGREEVQRVAGHELLGEITAAEALKHRAALDATLARKRDRLQAVRARSPSWNDATPTRPPSDGACGCARR